MFKSKTVSKFLNMVCKILNIGKTSEVLVTLLIMYYCMNFNLYAKLHFSVNFINDCLCVYIYICVRIYVLFCLHSIYLNVIFSWSQT